LQHLARPRRVAVCVQPGAFEVTVVSDGHLVLPTSFLAPEAPPAEPEVLLTEEQYNPPTNVTLIRSDSDLILVDMGSRRPIHADCRKTLGQSQNCRRRQSEDH